MRESKFQKSVLDKLEELGYYAVKVIICNRKGWMDIVACSPTGRFVGIELKDKYNSPSGLQKIHIQEVKARGGVAFTAWTMAHVLEGLEKGYRDDGTDHLDSVPLL